MWSWFALMLMLSHTLAEREPGGDELPAHKRQSVQYSTLVGPSFINASLHSHAYAPTGKTAYFTCIVRNLHNHTVSWVRALDIHILTIGETTYTSDNRFVAVNRGGSDRWMLILHHVRPSDAGSYLCQVSTSPPMSTPITLTVTEAVASVRPGSDVYLKAGSKVILVCEVSGCPYPASPAWYKGHKLQEGIDVNEDRIQQQSIDSLMTTTSSLSLLTPISTFLSPSATATLTRPKAAAIHSGVYTCKNSCTSPVNLTLHVLTGDEEMAAMQHPSGSSGLISFSQKGCQKIQHFLILGFSLAVTYVIYFT